MDIKLAYYFKDNDNAVFFFYGTKYQRSYAYFNFCFIIWNQILDTSDPVLLDFFPFWFSVS